MYIFESRMLLSAVTIPDILRKFCRSKEGNTNNYRLIYTLKRRIADWKEPICLLIGKTSNS